VAHEVNNPLAAALSDQELARGAVEELDEAQEAGRRIARIVNDLTLFGRPDQKNPRARIRLIDVVDLAMRWLPVSVGQTATVTVENGGAPDVLATLGRSRRWW